MKQVLSLFTFGIVVLFSFPSLPRSSCRLCGFMVGQVRPVQHESSAFARLPLPDICYNSVA
jgi:hypothetical protein